ncbi:MAG: hypothetical protein HZB50_12030 [Chloroflexi bacterium]|nr:hypothetical protein [Chloroflexota bacterium]
MVGNIKELKRAHFALLKSYSIVLEKVAYLPYINTFADIKNPPNDVRGLRKLFRNIAFIFSLCTGNFSLKTLVRFFVEIHIARKLQEIKFAYVQNSTVTSPDSKEGREYRGWLVVAMPELDALSGTLLTRKNLMEAVSNTIAAGGAFILTLLGLNQWGDIIPKITIFLSPYLGKSASGVLPYFVVFVLIAAILFNLVISAFRVKRALFLCKDEKESTTYWLEDVLFRFLRRSKNLEFPVDVFCMALMTIVLPLTYFLFDIVWRKDQSHSLIQLPDKIFAPIIIIVFLFIVLWDWRKNRQM